MADDDGKLTQVFPHTKAYDPGLPEPQGQLPESYAGYKTTPEAELADEIPVLTEVLQEGKPITPEASVEEDQQEAPSSPELPKPQFEHLPSSPRAADNVAASDPITGPTRPLKPGPLLPEHLLAELGLPEQFDDEYVPVHDLSEFLDHGELEFSVNPDEVFDPSTDPPQAAWSATSTQFAQSQDDFKEKPHLVVSAPEPRIDASRSATTDEPPPVAPVSTRESKSDRLFGSLPEKVMDEIVADFAEQIRESLELNLKRQLDSAIASFLDSYQPRLNRIAKAHMETYIARAALAQRQKDQE